MLKETNAQLERINALSANVLGFKAAFSEIIEFNELLQTCESSKEIILDFGLTHE